MDTDRSLQAVIGLAQRERPRPALLLATGDLSDSGSAASYQRFAAYTQGLADTGVWLPGNHDDMEAMAAGLAADARLCSHLLLGGWLVVGLNSQIVGDVAGALAPAELERLGGLLAEHTDIPTLVCLHHQVLPVGCAWLDRQRLGNADQLLALIAAHPQVKAVLSGHVHQVSEQYFGSVRLLTSPSTCVQFAPDSDEFRIDPAAPGYRWLKLYEDGGLDTGVSRVEDASLIVDLHARGY